MHFLLSCKIPESWIVSHIDPVIFVSLLLISVITSATTENVKRQARRARASEQSMRSLYDFSQKLANAPDTDRMVQLTMQYLHEQLNTPVLYMEKSDSIVQNQELVYG